MQHKFSSFQANLNFCCHWDRSKWSWAVVITTKWWPGNAYRNAERSAAIRVVVVDIKVASRRSMRLALYYMVDGIKYERNE